MKTLEKAEMLERSKVCFWFCDAEVQTSHHLIDRPRVDATAPVSTSRTKLPFCCGVCIPCHCTSRAVGF